MDWFDDLLRDVFRQIYLTDSNGIEFDTLEDYELYGDAFVPVSCIINESQNEI